MRIPRINLIYALYFSGLFVLFFCCGGLIVIFCEERVAPAASQYAVLGLLIGAFALLAVACGFRLLSGRWLPATARRGDAGGAVAGRHLFFSTLLFAILV